MSDEPLEKLIPVGASVILSGIAAFLSGTYGFVRQVRDDRAKVAALELRVAAVEKLATDGHTAVGDARRKATEDDESTKAHLLAEIAKLRKEIDDDLDELVKAQKSMRDSSNDFAKDAELAKFIENVNERWFRMERTIGKIEGIVERMAQRQSDRPPERRR